MIELSSNHLVFTFPRVDSLIERRAREWIDARLARASRAERRILPTGDSLYRKFEHCIPKVRAEISFQRTLRIPDDGKDYPLPPGLGAFPLRHVDDFDGVPPSWKKHGGIMLPMHKTEAVWLNFRATFPMALKVGAGGICAVSGGVWSEALEPKPQNYLVLPDQPWLDGFRIADGVIRHLALR